MVLVAEDDPDQSDMVRDVLVDEGYAVETVFSGEAALKKLLKKPYNLVILDIRMPGLDGASVLKQFRQQNKDVPVVVVSAFATEADMQKYRSYGADGCLSKPYEVHELLSLVERLAHRDDHEDAHEH